MQFCKRVWDISSIVSWKVGPLTTNVDTYEEKALFLKPKIHKIKKKVLSLEQKMHTIKEKILIVKARKACMQVGKANRQGARA
jgi:phage shock protein A